MLNFKKASEIFINVRDLNEHLVIFKSKSGTFENPFWNQINGPIEDAIWHSGQIVVLRRASGNPIDPKVNVFKGIQKVRVNMKNYRVMDFLIDFTNLLKRFTL